ncbi:MAG: ABC transporter ATP-binding protein [Anaerolineales bacterium]
MAQDLLYSIRNLSVQYHTRQGIVDAVNDVSLDIYRGEVLGLVGESGCGKSTLGKAIMRMIREPGRIASGELVFDGVDLLKISEREMRTYRGKRIGMIFQDPMTSLNPVQRIVEHLTETVRTHEMHVSEKAARSRAEELIDRLGIRRERIDDYPHQLSGGMRQRVMISLALALQADIVIADEATTSLDVIVEAQFLDLLRELKNEFNLTIILITHNIGIVAELADRVAVMYAGRMAELGDVHEVFGDPQHPYAQGLLKSVPNIQLQDDELYKMEGAPPNLADPPQGCRFHPRCPHVMEVCTQRAPAFQNNGDGHFTACWLYEDQPEAVATMSAD